MKAIRKAVCLLFVFASAAAFAQSDAQKSFDKMKSLVGSWEGKTSGGQSVTMTYSLVSGGTVVMSDGAHDSMVTMYALDGNRLLMTHYCAMGTQPRMSASLSPDGKTLEFTFVDATNLSSPQAAHMHHALFTFVDANHYSEEWTFTQDGQSKTEHFDLHRKS